MAGEIIPQAHKVVLEPIAAGEPIIRYGHVIGFANRDLASGSRAREEFINLPAAPELNSLPLSTAVPDRPAPAAGLHFSGLSKPGRQCGHAECACDHHHRAVCRSHGGLRRKRIKAEVLPRYPNVDDVVAITHTYGCGVAIDAPGAAIPIRTLRHISLHANAAAWPLIVSLGCEKLQPERSFPDARFCRCWRATTLSGLQSERGFAATVAAIIEAAESGLAFLNRRQRERVPASDLVRRVAVRRQRRVLRRDLQSGGRVMPPICLCARGNGAVFGSDRSSRRDSSAHTAGGHSRCRRAI